MDTEIAGAYDFGELARIDRNAIRQPGIILAGFKDESSHVEGGGRMAPRGPVKSRPKVAGMAASRRISARIAELADWRGETLARVRALIREADPDVVEEWKWKGTPVWCHDGGICTGESYRSTVKLTFFKGASLKDPARLFNSSLDGNTRRAIDMRESEAIDANAFKALIRAAVALNGSGK
jgi:hypothetical protein